MEIIQAVLVTSALILAGHTLVKFVLEEVRQIVSLCQLRKDNQ